MDGFVKCRRLPSSSFFFFFFFIIKHWKSLCGCRRTIKKWDVGVVSTKWNFFSAFKKKGFQLKKRKRGSHHDDGNSMWLIADVKKKLRSIFRSILEIWVEVFFFKGEEERQCSASISMGTPIVNRLTVSRSIHSLKSLPVVWCAVSLNWLQATFIWVSCRNCLYSRYTYMCQCHRK